jgi:alpha-1,6-mannosyltransferase
MKIVDVAEFYAERGGGVRTYVEQKLAAASTLGHQLVVIAPGPRDHEERRAGGRIVWLKQPVLPIDRRYHMFVSESAIHAALQREAPDVIEGSSPWAGGWAVARYDHPPAGPRPIKSFIFHQDPVAVYPQTFLGRALGEARVDRLFAWYWRYLRALSRDFDATIVSSPWLADRLERFGIQRPLAVPFGVDKQAFAATGVDAALRAELIARAGAPPHAALLITLSRLHPEKRVGTMIEAVRRVAASRPVALAIFGDGPLRRWIDWQARGAPVHVHGFVTDRARLARALASADALLHGSAAETYGLVVAEALCAGLPLVVPDRGGASDLARPAHAETYRAGDAAACAAAIQRLLARVPPRLHAAARQAADELVASTEQHFTRLFRTYEALRDARVGRSVVLG